MASILFVGGVYQQHGGGVLQRFWPRELFPKRSCFGRDRCSLGVGTLFYVVATIPTIFHFRSAEIMGDSHLLILIVCARRRGGFVCFAGGTFYFCTDESKSKQILL